jgi:hypothetical protein
MNGEQGGIFTLRARRCKRCGGILINSRAIEDGYGHICKMKAAQEGAARKPIDGQMTWGDLGGARQWGAAQ